MRGPLPVYVEDPVARLRVERRAMDGLKESKQAVGAEMLAGTQIGPRRPRSSPGLSSLNFSTRLFNLHGQQQPGPQFPLYILGRELLDMFPVAFLPRGQGSPSRSCPTTAAWSSGCSATTTGCPTSTS